MFLQKDKPGTISLCNSSLLTFCQNLELQLYYSVIVPSRASLEIGLKNNLRRNCLNSDTLHRRALWKLLLICLLIYAVLSIQHYIFSFSHLKFNNMIFFYSSYLGCSTFELPVNFIQTRNACEIWCTEDSLCLKNISCNKFYPWWFHLYPNEI